MKHYPFKDELANDEWKDPPPVEAPVMEARDHLEMAQYHLGEATALTHAEMKDSPHDEKYFYSINQDTVKTAKARHADARELGERRKLLPWPNGRPPT